jgi:hypothetical protein
MKKSLFLYLFILAALMNVFTYMYLSKKATFDQSQLQSHNARLKDSVLLVSNQLSDANYFTLENNENAKEYLQEYDTSKLIPVITAKIMDRNDRPEGNPLIPYDKINAQKFIINKVKVLNHRWIIADFSDGTVWGELLLKYFVEDDQKITFERIESQLYQKRTE